jgi:hypothetical protein
MASLMRLVASCKDKAHLISPASTNPQRCSLNSKHQVIPRRAISQLIVCKGGDILLSEGE